MNIINTIIFGVVLILTAYVAGRLFAAGLMDEINRKFNKFTITKKEKDGTKEKE